MTGLKPIEFSHLFTPSEVYYWFKGKGRENDYLFSLASVGWNVNRWTGANVWNSNAKKGHQKSAQRLLRLPSDNNTPIEKIAEKDTAEMLRKGNKVMKIMMN